MAVLATVYGRFDTVLLDGVMAVFVAVAGAVFGSVLGGVDVGLENMLWSVAEAIWEAVFTARLVSEAALLICSYYK